MFLNNKVKKKLSANQLTIGSWITMAHMSIPEIMSSAGFDWLTIDMEHSIIELEKAQMLISSIESKGIVPLVRVEENSYNTIKRVMDAGAYGVIVPMVNSRQDAERAVQAIKYPPAGTRGVGLARAQKYGIGFDDYVKKLKKNSILIVQIEHIKAVNNLEEIISVKGVDSCIIGPYDLSGSLGIPGRFDHPDMINALRHVEEICRQKNFPMGFHVIPADHDLMKQRIESGYTFLAFSLDFMFLGSKCRDEMNMLRSKLE